VRRRAAHTGDRFDHLLARALDEALGYDLALQMLRREFGAERMDAGVEGDHVQRLIRLDWLTSFLT